MGEENGGHPNPTLAAYPTLPVSYLSNALLMEYQFDLYGNTTADIDGLGNQSSYLYDDLNRMVLEIDANGERVSMNFDAVGNELSLIDAIGNRTTWEYDD
jgi:YD repeat-containing protein